VWDKVKGESKWARRWEQTGNGVGTRFDPRRETGRGGGGVLSVATGNDLKKVQREGKQYGLNGTRGSTSENEELRRNRRSVAGYGPEGDSSAKVHVSPRVMKRSRGPTKGARQVKTREKILVQTKETRLCGVVQMEDVVKRDRGKGGKGALQNGRGGEKPQGHAVRKGQGGGGEKGEGKKKGWKGGERGRQDLLGQKGGRNMAAGEKSATECWTV